MWSSGYSDGGDDYQGHGFGRGGGEDDRHSNDGDDYGGDYGGGMVVTPTKCTAVSPCMFCAFGSMPSTCAGEE